MARLLGAVRLSHDTDATNSPAVQREKIQGFAALHDHEVIAVTQDLDTSGTVPAMQRASLGPWLTDPAKIALYDVIAVSKLDRLSRSLADFAGFYEWCEANGKTIVSVAESLDFSTATGRMFAQLLVMFSQHERERMSERRSEAAVKIRRAGRWGGGKPSFGYQPVKTPGGWRLEPHPVYGPVTVQLAEKAIAGDTYNGMARWLAESGVPTPLDAAGAKPRKDGAKREWLPETVKLILTSPNLTGIVTERDKATGRVAVVRGDDGMPKKFTNTPLLSDDQFAAVQLALTGRTRTAGERLGGHMLLRVAFCGNDGRPLYAAMKRNRGYGYYRCVKCGIQLRMEPLESAVINRLLDEAGDLPVIRRTEHPAVSHDAELRSVEKSITDLQADRNQYGLYRGEQGHKDYVSWMTKLEAQREALATIADSPASVEHELTGQTIAEYWSSLDDDDKGRALRKWGVTITANKEMTEVSLGQLEGAGMAAVFGYGVNADMLDNAKKPAPGG